MQESPARRQASPHVAQRGGVLACRDDHNAHRRLYLPAHRLPDYTNSNMAARPLISVYDVRRRPTASPGGPFSPVPPGWSERMERLLGTERLIV